MYECMYFKKMMINRTYCRYLQTLQVPALKPCYNIYNNIQVVAKVYLNIYIICVCVYDFETTFTATVEDCSRDIIYLLLFSEPLLINYDSLCFACKIKVPFI